MYKYDTHVHTQEVSFCGRLSAKETVRQYKNAGYKGICITDHYRKDYFDTLTGYWQSKVKCFLRGYYEALEEGEKTGIDVLLGTEISIEDGTINDYLMVGVTEKFLFENEELYSLSIGELSDLIRKNKMMLFQAHPMRKGMTILDYSLLTGIEVFNGNPGHNSQNEAAYNFAKEHNLKMLAGSDCHATDTIGTSGIVTNRIITNSTELLTVIDNNEYSIIGDSGRLRQVL